MKKIIYILSLILFISACNPNNNIENAQEIQEIEFQPTQIQETQEISGIIKIEDPTGMGDDYVSFPGVGGDAIQVIYPKERAIGQLNYVYTTDKIRIKKNTMKIDNIHVDNLFQKRRPSLLSTLIILG